MRTAIIIGATSGLGNEVARILAGKGWKLGIAGRRAELLEAFQAEFGSENVTICQMDITSPASVQALDELIAATGAPDLLLHVSGIGHQNPSLDEDKEIRTVRTNCEGMVRIVDHFVNYVKANPQVYTKRHKAHVAVVSSVAGTTGMGLSPAYSATKKMQGTYITALSQLSRMENIPVQFTEIRPGFVATEILNPNMKYPMMMTKQEAAKHMVHALERRKRIYIFDWRYRALVAFWRLIPRCIWERMTFVRTSSK